MLAVAAALAGSCAPSPFGLAFDGPVTITLSDYPELSDPGGVAVVRGVNVPIAVANLGDGDYTALSLVCPHQGGRLWWSGDTFSCSLHGATFAGDGHWVGGQQARDMYEYRTSYDAAAGTVTISR